MADPTVAVQAAPTQGNPNRKALYDAIKDSGKFKLGDEAWFDKVLDDDSLSAELYKALEGSKAFKLPSQEDWGIKFGKKKDQTGSDVSGAGSPLQAGGEDTRSEIEKSITSIDPNQPETPQVSLGTPEIKEDGGFDLNTAKGIQLDVQKRLSIDIGEAQDKLVDNIQAELDAGNITEEEANTQLDQQFTEAQNTLIDQYEAEFEASVNALAEKQEAAKGDELATVPNVFGSIFQGEAPVEVKKIKDLSPFERGLLTGVEMIKAIPDQLGLVHQTGTIKGANDILGLIEGKPDDEIIGGYTVKQIRDNVQAEKEKAVTAGLENFRVASEKLKKYQAGSKVPQSFSEIDSYEKFGDFAMSTIGQAMPQAAGAITAGAVGTVAPPVGMAMMGAVAMGTVAMETGIIQMEMVEELAAKTGKSVEDILEEALINPQAAIAGGLFAGSLDMLSLGLVLKGTGLQTLARKFIKEGVKKIGKDMTVKQVAKEVGKGVLVGAVSEGITEPTQGVIESVAAAQGAKGLDYEFDSEKFKTEMAAGSIMGGVFSGGGKIASTGANIALRGNAIKAEANLKKEVAKKLRAGKKPVPPPPPPPAPPAPPAAPVTNIKQGSVMEIETKTGKKKIKRVDGKWKFKNKKGKFVAVPQKQQAGLDEKYLEAKNKKSDGKAKEKAPAEGKAPTKEGDAKAKVPKREEPSSLKEGEKVATSLKIGDKITDVNGSETTVKEVTVHKDGQVTVKDTNGVTSSMSGTTVLKVEGAKKEAPVKSKPVKKEEKVPESKPVKKETVPVDKKSKAKAAVKKAAKKAVDKKKAPEKSEPAAPVKKEPLKDLVPKDPNSIQNELSNAMRDGNRKSEVLLNFKEKNPSQFKKDGSPRANATEQAKNLYNINEEAKTRAEGLRADLQKSKEAATPKTPEPLKEAASLKDQIEEINKQIRVLEPAARNLIRGRIDTVHNKKKNKPFREKSQAMSDRVHELKQERKALKEQLGNRGVIENDVARVDPKAEVTQVGKPKKIGKSGTVETDYTFKAAGMEGSIKRIESKGAADLFYAFTPDGKTTTAFESARHAVKSLRQQQPRHITQTGAPVTVEVFGREGIGTKATGTIAALEAAGNVVRTELGLKSEKQREMKVFIEGGDIATVSLTNRGKVNTINKKTGKTHGKFIPKSSKALQNHPDVALTMQGKGTPATDARLKQDVTVDPKVKDTKMTDLAKVKAKNLRGKKIKIENGVLRASLGFEEVYNAAIEIAATILEGGGQFADAMRAAMKHMRNSSWYKDLKGDDKILKDQMVEDEIRKLFLDAGQPLDIRTVSRAVARERDRIYKENKGRITDKAQWAIFERRVDLSLAAFRTNLIIQHINLRTSPIERELVPFIMEKTDIPESLGRPDLVEAYKNRDVKKLNAIAAFVKAEMDNIWKTTEKYRGNIREEEIADYITHIWDIKKTKRLDVISHFTRKDKWNSPRYIETLKEGIDRFQLTPKMLDVSEILAIRASSANNMIANNKFMENLVSARVQGKPIVMPRDKAPEEWLSIDGVPSLQHLKFHPHVKEKLGAIFRLRLSDNDTLNGIERLNALIKGGQLSASFFHHFALLEAAIPILGYKVVDAVAIQSLGRSLASFYGKGTDVYSEMAGEPSKKKLQSSLPYTMQNQAMAIEAIKHGLQLGSTIDVRVKELESMFSGLTGFTEWLGDKAGGLFGIKGAGKITKAPAAAVEGVIKANNALLWDYLHDTLKLMAYEKKVSKVPKSKNTPELIAEYKKEQAQFINDSFGGQNFDVLGFSPQALQGAKILLLSPDWTISTLRQASPLLFAPFHQAAKTKGWKATEEVLGKFLAARKIGGFEFSGNYDGEARFRKLMGAQFKSSANDRAITAYKFWGGALAVMALAYASLNAFNRKEDMEENPELYSKKEHDDWETLMMWNNSSGHMTHVFDGRYEDGTERYIRQGKQFRELPEFFIDDSPEFSMSFPKPALKKFGGKGSPLLQIASKAFTDRSLSGFEDHALKDKESWAWSVAFAQSTAQSLAPFAFSTLWRDDKEFHALDLVFPSSKGMSMSKGVKLLQYYMVTDRSIEDKLEKQSMVMQEGIRNNLNITDMYTAALAGVQAEQTKELYKDYKTLDDIYKAINDETRSAKDTQRLVKQAKKMELDIAEKKIGYVTIFTNITKWLKVQAGEGRLESGEIEEVGKFIEQKAIEAEETYESLRQRTLVGKKAKQNKELEE